MKTIFMRVTDGNKRDIRSLYLPSLQLTARLSGNGISLFTVVDENDLPMRQGRRQNTPSELPRPNIAGPRRSDPAENGIDPEVFDRNLVLFDELTISIGIIENSGHWSK